MGATLNLPYKRYVRQVSNGSARSKYAYISMMQENAEALKTAPWQDARCGVKDVTLTVNKVSETDGVYSDAGEVETPPSFTVFKKDRYDCFMQGGDARQDTGQFCGYAGAAAYRFKLPSSASGVPLTSIRLPVSRDRYCRAGVRVVCVLSDDAEPSADWSVVRGEASGSIRTASTSSEGSVGVTSWGFMGQQSVGWLLQSRAAEGACEFTAAEFPALATVGKRYLWVYLTIEDYASYWELYDAKTQRYYSIEGSAMLMGGSCAFTFQRAVDADETDWVLARADMDGYPFAGSLIGSVDDWGSWAKLATYSGVLLPAMMSRSVERAVAEQVMRDGRYSFCVNGTKGGGTMTDVRYLNRFGGGAYSDVSKRGTDRYGLMVLLWTVYRPQGVSFEVSGGKEFLRDAPFLLLGYYPVVAPSGRDRWTTLKIRSETSKVACLNCDVGLNVWRSRSLDLLGAYGRPAFGCLAQDPAFFTGSKNTVSGTVTGDGTKNSDMTLEAEAELIATVPTVSGMWESFSEELDISLEANPVLPGDIVILAPRVRTMAWWTGDSSNERSLVFWGSGAAGSVEAAAAEYDSSQSKFRPNIYFA